MTGSRPAVAADRSVPGAPASQAAPQGGPDPRRRIPRTDVLLADPRLAEAVAEHGPGPVTGAVQDAQRRAREGQIAPEEVADAAVVALPRRQTTLRPVINATGVLVHTNLGRAPLSRAAGEALRTAAGCTDVEYDLGTGARATRGRGVLAALQAAVPAAGAVHVVNNNAAALLLVATGLARGREVLISRGELVEIGDGFRLPDLLASTGARLREVGTTNRTTAADYADAAGPGCGFILKVHPSNFRISGFTSAAGVAALTGLGVPVVVDIGSGLLRREPKLPEEPDADTVLRQGAALVTASGDKLLGGPQAGLLLGEAALVNRLRRHPMARALRVDKLTLAALEATLRGPDPPTAVALHTPPQRLRSRAGELAARLRARGVDAVAADSRAAVGGGGAPGVTLASGAVGLPARYAAPLRQGDPAVAGRIEDGRLRLDLLAVPPELDEALVAAVCAVAAEEVA